MSERELAETLGELDSNDHIRVTVEDGTEFDGPASPIDYVPEESLRVEVRPGGGTTDRYRISGDYDDGWSELTVRHTEADDPDPEWTDLGTVEEVEVEEGRDGGE